MRTLDFERLAVAQTHPLQLAVLRLMLPANGGPRPKWTPRELSEQVDGSLPLVSYHVRRLAAMGLVELIATNQVRGTVEHVYRITNGAMTRAS